MGRQRDDIKTEDVVRLYESGLSIMNVASALDVSETLVKGKIARRGSQNASAVKAADP